MNVRKYQLIEGGALKGENSRKWESGKGFLMSINVMQGECKSKAKGSGKLPNAISLCRILAGMKLVVAFSDERSLNAWQ